MNKKRPVIIGGLGGSGTRLIAEILIELNCFLGSDLNESSDNLSFTYLFKRPHIYFKEKIDKEIFKNSLTIFTNSMLGNKVFTKENIVLLLNLLRFNILKKYNQFNSKREALFRIKNIIKPKEIYNSNHRGWGWKEPNSHIFINELVAYYPNMKYIHVIRHGLDMAFSENKQQLQNWHSLFNVEIPKEKHLIPVAQLEYWIRANERVISIAKKKLGNRFLLLNFDNLCNNPQKELVKILDFMEIKKNNRLLKKLLTMPKVPTTKGRYKAYNTNIFSDTQIEKIKAFGFRVD